MHVGSEGKDEHQHQQGTRTSNTDVNTCKNCGGTGHRVEDCWRPGGGAYDSSNNDTNEGKHNNKGKGKGKHLVVVQTSQSSETASTLSCPSQTPSTIEALWCNPDTQQKGWIMTIVNPFTVFKKERSWCRVLAA